MPGFRKNAAIASLSFFFSALTAIGQTATTTALGISPAPSTFGTSVVLTATVSPAAATGKVTFYDGVQALGTSALSGGTATFQTVLNQTGIRRLRALYHGSGSHLKSLSSTLNHTVNVVPSFGLTMADVDLAGLIPGSVAVGDFNGDGEADLVTFGAGNGVRVRLGTGTGAFGSPLLSLANNVLVYTVTADFDGDGLLDVAGSNPIDNQIEVLFGQGNGFFQSPVVISNLRGPLVSADFNGDGFPDLAVAQESQGQVSVLRSNGNRTFQAPVARSVQTSFGFMAAGDMNEDGRVDLVLLRPAPDEFSRNLIVLAGQGDGTFSAPQSIPLNTGPTGGVVEYFALGDLNGDGHLDVGIAQTGTALTILLGAGNGTFGTPLFTGTEVDFFGLSQGIAILDITGDGHADVVLNRSFAMGNAIQLYSGNGDGTFQPVAIYSYSNPFHARAILPSDFNSDGRVDWATFNLEIAASSIRIIYGSLSPLLRATMTHAGGDWEEGETGTFTITVSNAAGAAITTGTVTVQGFLPGGLTFVSMSGSGWSCTDQTCTRGDSLAGGASYPPITVTATVQQNALTPQPNRALISGGGSASAEASDDVHIVPPPCTYTLTPSSIAIAKPSLQGSFAVSAPNACQWTPVSQAPWIGLVTSGPISGSTTVAYAIQENNTGLDRSGTITVADKVFTVWQSGGGTPVPGLSGLSKAAAIAALQSAGLAVGNIRTSPDPNLTPGTVILQSPIGSTLVLPGTPVDLVLVGSAPIIMTPNGGDEGRQVFLFRSKHQSGASNIQYAQVLVSKNGLNAQNACYVSYDRATNVFYLLNDDLTQWYGLLGGTANTIGNSQCTIHGATSGSVIALEADQTEGEGRELHLSVDISFRSGFSGLKKIHHLTGDTLGNTSGWTDMGIWQDFGDPNVVEVTSFTPNSGTGASQTFTASVTDGNGAGTIPFIQLVMNNELSGYNGCFIHYDRASNVFFLLNDAGTEFSGMFAGSGQVSNSQCTLNGSGSGGVVSGNTMTVTYNLTFAPGFSGLKKTYMQAVDTSGVIQVWRQVGTWTR